MAKKNLLKQLNHYSMNSTAEQLYSMIKALLQVGMLKTSDIGALAELITELYNRKKEEESVK